jgi:signal transduction histidine kinase
MSAISVLARIAVAPVEANDSGMRGLRILACGVALATCVLLTIGLLQVLEILPSDQENWIPLAIYPFLALAILSPAVVGLLIALQLPRNRIAWILLLGALLPALQIASEQLVGAAWAYQTEGATVPPILFAWPLAVAFVFPDGRLLSRRWRWAAGIAIVSFSFTIGLKLFDPEPYPAPNEDVANPLLGNAVGELIVETGIWIPFAIGVLASLFAGALSVILRFRRSVGVERLQMKWLVWGASLIPLVLPLDIVLSTWFGGGGVTFALLLVAQFAFVAAIGVAVVRYRLYAIDRLVNRTLVYVTLTLVLLAVYAAITIGLGVVVGGDSSWVVALATLAVALAFRPLRARIQDLVDRRFRRARYEGVRRVRAFEDEVRDGVRAPEEIGVVLADALQDPLAEIFFWVPETGVFADTTGDRLDELPHDDRARREIERDDTPTAVLLHDPALLERRDLLDGILSAAALSIEMARLRVEVRLQLAEVQASRARIVEAGYEERRRLERDLHDGAQQRLVSLGVQVRRLQLSLPRDAAQILSPSLDRIVAEVGEAIADLRQIAAGVRPARLDEGLAAALRDLARTSPVPVDVDATGVRAPASVEAAAYFVACEALTNAVKHGSPSRVTVRAVQDNGTLHVTVADDGIGGAVVRRGSGLAGLRDRVAAHGGTLEIVSPRGSGTRVEVAIPCGS